MLENKRELCAVVVPYRIPILIRESEMWELGEERPDFVLRNMVGASIDVIVTKVERTANRAQASRRQASRSQRRFFAAREDLHAAGSRITCRMLAVGPRRCLVDCYGYDLDMTQREIRYAAIPDLRTEFHPGSEIDCIVKEYHPRTGELIVSAKETEVNPFFGAEERHPVGSRRFAMISGKYGGGVFCNLPDGVTCMCNYVAMVEAYSHGWMYSSIFSAPETQMCRGALYDSAFAAAGIPIYDNTLYDREALSAYENTLRIAGEFQLCDSGSNPQEIVTRAETARFLHAILTRNLTVEAPTVPVKLKNPTDINANDFLLELQKVPEAILAEFNQRGWAYSIDFDRVAQFAEELNVSCIGVTDYAAKTIYVSEASATVHEFGHFLDKVLGFPAEHERLFCEEAESSILRDYAKTNAHEYFADCFVYWIMYNESAKRMERFKQSAPQTYAYFESLTAIEDLSKQPPWGNDISEDITNLSNYFVTSDGEDFLTILLHALEKAKDVNEDVNIESM